MSDEAEVVEDAKVAFTSDFQTVVTGQPRAGRNLVVSYALDRLPQCRGNVGGGGPGWAIAGYYSENGGPAKMFDPTALAADGKDRETKAVSIPLTQGGDLAFWFTVSSRWGCHEYDSAFGQNFHIDVSGAPPETGASIFFGADGEVHETGTLTPGSKVKIRYEQDRLPECRRVQNGNPLWTISGFASFDGADAETFQTGRPDGSDREAIDAVLDVPNARELALWFQVNDVGGCNELDSNGGKNYRFEITGDQSRP